MRYEMGDVLIGTALASKRYGITTEGSVLLFIGHLPTDTDLPAWVPDSEDDFFDSSSVDFCCIYVGNQTDNNINEKINRKKELLWLKYKKEKDVTRLRRLLNDTYDLSYTFKGKYLFYLSNRQLIQKVIHQNGLPEL